MTMTKTFPSYPFSFYKILQMQLLDQNENYHVGFKHFLEYLSYGCLPVPGQDGQQEKTVQEEKGGKEGEKVRHLWNIVFFSLFTERDRTNLFNIWRSFEKTDDLGFYSFLTCGGRSKKTEVETDQMKEAQKMEEVEQLAKMIIQSLELFDFLSIYQDSSSGHVSNRLQALWRK